MKVLNLNKFINGNPFIIAEISANHQQSKEKAKELIDIASDSGANAVKFQTFTPDSLTLNSNKKNFILKKDSNWSGRSLYDLYTEAATPYEWHEDLFNYAKLRGLIPFTSVFSIKDIPFLESIDLQIYKIASYEANDIELVEEVAKIGKPVIMSIGGCNEKEVKASIKILKKYLVNNFAVLNCLSSYPAPLSEFSFGRTVRFKDEFKVTTGLSDHSNNSDAALITLALGGIIFEKHIILDNKDSAKALDKDFSASKKEFKAYVKSINDGFFSLKQNQFKPMKSETSNVILKRSIYSTKDIAIGEVFTKDNTRSIRPSDGLHPHKYKKLLGVKSKRNIEENTPIKETDLL